MAFLLTKLKNLYVNQRGFYTNRKLVVFESDDWGSIRMPSKATFTRLQERGDHPENDAFLSNDCLESEDDLHALFNVLSSVVDVKGNHPIMTLNFAVANPNFDKIDYQNGVYEYEPFYQTYEKYYGNSAVLDVVKEGIAQKLILPQLHCREHLNVERWMRHLKEGRLDTLLAFENKTMGVGASFGELNKFGYMDAFNTDCSSNEQLERIVSDAAQIFQDVFGYQSVTFVASCFVWNDALERALHKNGVEYIQSAPWQQKPVGKNGVYKLKRVLRYSGQKNKNGQRYGIRNCGFEPAFKQNPQECVERCLQEIERAFKAKKPAVIGTHRFNFIGSINEKNRENNLLGFKVLLEEIVKRYPDVEFLSSAQLYEMMKREKK